MAEGSDVSLLEGVFHSLKGGFGRSLANIPAFISCSHLISDQESSRLSIQSPNISVFTRNDLL
jgi:hypothetical protein